MWVSNGVIEQHLFFIKLIGSLLLRFVCTNYRRELIASLFFLLSSGVFSAVGSSCSSVVHCVRSYILHWWCGRLVHERAILTCEPGIKCRRVFSAICISLTIGWGKQPTTRQQRHCEIFEGDCYHQNRFPRASPKLEKLNGDSNLFYWFDVWLFTHTFIPHSIHISKPITAPPPLIYKNLLSLLLGWIIQLICYPYIPYTH